jgi:glycosyltransferase involved in cell wall biosynthesis
MIKGRILTVSDHLGAIGGSEVAQLATFQGLADLGWDIHLLYRTSGDLLSAWTKVAATKSVIRASIPDRSSPVRSVLGSMSAAVVGYRLRPTLCYMHSAGDVPLARAVATMARCPVIVHLHLPPPVNQPDWLNRQLRQCSAVIAPSGDARHRWVDAAGIPSDRVAVISTGVDLNRFVPVAPDVRAASRQDIGRPPGQNLVLYMGRIEPNKGLHHLVEAVRASEVDMHLVVCGIVRDQPYCDSLHLTADDGRTTFLGHVGNVPALMAAADLVVVPSDVPETQGLVISEAMASGTPVVAFDVGGVADSMQGFVDQLVPAGDGAALRRAIERTVVWRSNDPTLGDQSRAWAEANMGITRTTEAIDSLLERLGNHGDPRHPVAG